MKEQNSSGAAGQGQAKPIFDYAGFFGSWDSMRYSGLLTFTRIFMALVFISILVFDALLYVNKEHLTTWLGYGDKGIVILVVLEIMIFSLLAVLANNSYKMYVYECESRHDMLITQVTHQQECQRLKESIRKHQEETFNSDGRTALDNTQRLVGHLYSLVMDNNSTLKTIESKLSLSNKGSISNYNVFPDYKETLSSIYTVVSKVLNMSLSIEDKLDKGIPSPYRKQDMVDFRNLVTRMEKVEADISESINERVSEEVGSIKKLLKQLSSLEEDLRASVSEGKNIHKYEALKVKLMTGQLDQLLERTEVLDTAKEILRKYSALLSFSKGDINDFLRFDELISKPLSELNLSKEIRDVLTRNGFETIESLVLNNAMKIQEETRLGPKRMQRLEAALKNYSPELSFGMTN